MDDKLFNKITRFRRKSVTEKISIFKKVKSTDAAIFLAAITGTMYMFGYAYFELYYSTLGVNVRVLTLDSPSVLMYGFLNFYAAYIWILIILFIIGGYKLTKKINVENKKILRVIFNFFYDFESGYKKWLFEFRLIFISMLLVMFITILMLVHGREGKNDAMKFLNGNCVLTATSYSQRKNEFVTSKKMCLLTINKGNYWFLDLDKKFNVIPEVVSMPLTSISCFRSFGSLSYYKKNLSSKEIKNLSCYGGNQI